MLQLLGFILLFILISVWLGRHMLDKGQMVAPLSLPSLNGELVNINWPSDQQRTLVYFFAPWCSVCHISMPGLNLFVDSQSNDLQIVAIALDYENSDEVRQTIQDSGFKGQVLLGNQQLARTFNITAYPSYYMLDQHGRILHSDRGLTTPVGVWLRARL